ncbi:hypothetical protein DM02DRAFT_541962, partial [Periconia macrospinosa]
SMVFAHTFHRNKGAQADLIVQTLLLFLDFVTLGLRLWSRQLRRIGLKASDWLIIASTFFLTARYAGELCLIFLGGLGLHIEEALAIGGAETSTHFLKILYAIDLLWITTCTLTKLSVIFFYIQIFYINKKLVWTCWITIGITIAYGLASGFHFAFYCTPVRKSWFPTLPGHCGDDNVKYLMWGSIDIVLDSFIICIPVPILSSLQLPMAKKLGLLGVFGLAMSIIAIMGIRFKFYNELDLTDPTYGLTSMALFAALVPLLGIINANIPTIPPALHYIFKSNIFGTTQQTSGTATTTPPTWSTKKGKTSRFDTDFERLSDPDIPLVNVPGKG